jgi:hypothetical protein
MRITSELFEQLPIKVREIIKNKIITGMANRITKQNNKIIELEEKTNVIKVEEINAIKGKEIKQIVFTKVKTSKKSTW